MFEAALYDLDGLLVDSEPIHGRASEKALGVYGRKLSDIPENIRKSFYGKRVIDVAAGVVESLGLSISPQRWASERLAFFMQLIEEGIGLMPGVERSLDLFDRLSVRTGLVSSGDRDYVLRVLELTGVRSRFAAVVTGDDVTVGKPDPQCYLLGAKKLGADPARCLVLEDAHPGVLAGKAAGMKVIGVENLFNETFDGADLVLPSLAVLGEKTLAALER
ncbi:MAG: hypothetical protein A3F83_17210 [Candidatus Glassbacteria bacterium RIFCSPLOWO2_12_FULL_58_11]|uniref:HAD family hydrolase n=1 Tax=Candidatus Glassbacteria bacterium RIFCSPLOWO2_12_FULL_58_11 TaxID=1817867 RepID=A0A1F5YYP3_9BACT|nr:MAG: hypothetical protein A3F83_17210 [Candidatus Glassbacteria bacterium RIFCSPLOWO2_12_FULL_58_11]